MKYYAYCRKSSEEVNKQVQSIETQRRILEDFAQKNGLDIIDFVVETKSAMEDGNRPEFEKMLRGFEKKEAEGLLVAHIDRISRNGTESGYITKLFTRGIIKEIRTPSNTYNSIQSLFYLDIEFAMASDYSRRLSLRVREGIETKLKRGEYPSYAPLGYVNKNSKISPDKFQSNLVSLAFRLYSTGEYSLKQLTKLLYEKGLRGKLGAKINKSCVHRMLTNPVYYGFIRNKDKLYKGIHRPLIDKNIFDKVQENLNRSNIPKTQKHNFLYRGYLSCGKCNCGLTASIKKGKFIYYYCTNGKGNCDQHLEYLNETKMNSLFQELFNDFTVNEKIATLSLDQYLEEVRQKERHNQNYEKEIKKWKQKVQDKYSRLEGLYLEGSMPKERYEINLKKIQNDENAMMQCLQISQKQKSDSTLELLPKIKNTVCYLGKMFAEGDEGVKSDLLKALLWNSEIKDGKISKVRYKLPFAYFENINKIRNIELWRSR